MGIGGEITLSSVKWFGLIIIITSDPSFFHGFFFFVLFFVRIIIEQKRPFDIKIQFHIFPERTMGL